MEKNFNTDNFEQLLRETTDEFRLYPSKKVWHSIYNDLHPARKWPSVAILLLLITSIMYVGVTNSNEAIPSKAIAAVEANKAETGFSIVATTGARIDEIKAVPPNGTGNGLANNSSVINSTTPTPEIDIATSYKTNVPGTTKSKFQNIDKNIANPGVSNEYIEVVTAEASPEKTSRDGFTSNVSMVPGNTVSPQEAIVKTKVKANTNIKEGTAKIQLNAEEKSWMEDFVMHNKKPLRKWKDRVAYQVYVTPSVGYRTYKKNTDFELPASTSLLSNPGMTNNAPEYSLNHSHSLNIEGGTNLIFSYSGKLRLKAGLQFNYTNYRINAYVLNHPTFTSLLLNNSEDGHPILSTRTTSLANTPGPASKNLNNNTYQFSIPLGADFKIAGNSKLKWYAGATIQPTYVTGGNAYLASADLKNYVTDENIMRKFNLNAGFETFLSYKTRSGVILSAGPQFRMQILSTYNKEYSYDEKLYNMGVKLGITRSF